MAYITKEEIAEVIFQTSIYGGVPAANTALTVLKLNTDENVAPPKGKDI